VFVGVAKAEPRHELVMTPVSGNGYASFSFDEVSVVCLPEQK
jgi:hypothetical protein